MEKIENKKKEAKNWFFELRNILCDFIESIEENFGKNKTKFQKKSWKRDREDDFDTGGGEMRVLRGEIFEKAGVNISTVYGKLSKELMGKIPGTENNNKFWASGISLVIHPRSPLIPAVHMNTRFIVTNKFWFGGGADITPTNKKSPQSIELANIFHKNFRKTCENYKKIHISNIKIGVTNTFFYLIEENQGVSVAFFMIILTAAIGKMTLISLKMLVELF